MRWIIVVALGLTVAGGTASAQMTYDWRSGNTYSTTPTYGGGAHVQGFNTNTGSMWNTDIEPNGNMHGLDGHSNYWTYDRGTGTYMNSSGHGCIGTGYARNCW